MQIMTDNKERHLQLLCQQFLFTLTTGAWSEDVDDKDDAEETV